MNKNKIPLEIVKIGLIGDSCVGKTSIFCVYRGDKFKEENLITVGYDKSETIFTLENNKKIILIIWDTPGEERFHSIALNTTKSANGIVLIADLTNKESFDNIKKWLKDIDENLRDPCVVLFGNKADLPKDKWQVTSEEAKKYAEENKLIYFETSAKTNQGIKEGISYIVNQAYKKVKQKLNKNIYIGKDTRKTTKSKCSPSN